MTHLPFLDVADPDFSVRSGAVRAAREQGAYARTSYGLAVLRYDEVSSIIKDRRLSQGSAAWPDHVGVAGPCGGVVAAGHPQPRRARTTRAAGD